MDKHRTDASETTATHDTRSLQKTGDTDREDVRLEFEKSRTHLRRERDAVDDRTKGLFVS